MTVEFNDIIDYFQYNSVLILTMFAISVGALILKKITNGKSDKLLFSSYRSALLNPLTYLRFFTHILGHSNWEHLINNYIIILLVGPMIEEKYGTMDLLLMILITAFVVGLFNFIRGGIKLKGSSCIVFMLIVLSSFSNIQAGKIPITFILIFIFYVFREIKDLKADDGISHTGHIIGALCGAVFGFWYMNGVSLTEYFSNLF